MPEIQRERHRCTSCGRYVSRLTAVEPDGRTYWSWLCACEFWAEGWESAP